MKKLIIPFAILALLIACNGYGDKLTFEGTDVYYKDGATQEDAEKLGKYLVESGFADGNEKSVQLVKNEAGNFVFRMVVQEGAEEGNDMLFQLMGMGLSMSVFDNKPVDMDLCDNTFTSLKIIPFGFGESADEPSDESSEESEPASED